MLDHESGQRADQGAARYVLAIDLGSGGLKAAVVADTGEVAASVEEKTTTYMLPGGGVEQDPEQWWQILKKAASRVVRR